MANLLDQIAIGERLRRTREALGYNAGEFAKAAGILQSAYSQYETGTRRLTLVQAVKLCDKYSLTLDWLYRDEVSGLPQRLALKLAGSRRAKGGRG